MTATRLKLLRIRHRRLLRSQDERAGQDRGPSREKSDIAYMLDDHRYGEDPHPECFCEDCMKWDGGP